MSNHEVEHIDEILGETHLGDDGSAETQAFRIAPPWAEDRRRPLYEDDEAKDGYELEGLLASLVPERAGKGMLHKEAYRRIMRLYRTPDVLTRTSTIDPTLRTDATKANSIVERKNTRTALDAEARILLPLVHWTARFFQLVDPDSFESLYEEPEFSQETREECQRDAVAATKVITAQLHEGAQHALLVNRHHAAEAEQRTREQIGRELQLPSSTQELIRCTKSESS
jgi:hypothetical protein